MPASRGTEDPLPRALPLHRRGRQESAGDDQSKSLEKKEPLSRRARADDPAPAVEEPLEPLKEMEQSVLRALKAIQKVILRSFSEQE